MRNPRRGAKENTGNENWLLAAGDAGGTVTIWDLDRNIPPTRCRGSAYGVHALVFSPDGMTLASAGRYEAKLWDIATGRSLLNLGTRNTMRGLAFSPDGKRLAVGSIPAHGDEGGVDVWQLDNGRGLRLLRGLFGQVEKVIFSRDGRFLAALAHDWDLAVWDLEARRLLHVFEAPKGFFADNAGFAFDAESNRLACAAGSGALLWSLATGETLKSWSLPPGFQDQVAFHPSGKLLLFRVETAEENACPTSSRSQPPLVCRIRNLLDPTPLKPLAQIHSFGRYVALAAAAPDGSYFVVDGEGGSDGKHRSIRAFDGVTGVELWSKDSGRSVKSSHLAVDPTGQFLALMLGDDNAAAMVEMPSGKPLGNLGSFPLTLGPGATYRGQWDPHAPFRYVLYDKDRHLPLLNLKVNQPTSSILSSFDIAGRRFAWGNPDGSVTVCDLETVRRRLESVGLAWE
jgi:WD40 repeat protein